MAARSIAFSKRSFNTTFASSRRLFLTFTWAGMSRQYTTINCAIVSTRLLQIMLGGGFRHELRQLAIAGHPILEGKAEPMGDLFGMRLHRRVFDLRQENQLLVVAEHHLL